MKKFILFTTFLTLILYSSLKAQVNLQWAKQLEGTNNEIGTSIAVDASGNVYTIGYFDGTTDFDPDSTISNLTTAGYDDIFVSKLDASGNYVWAKKFGSTGFDDGQSIAVDASGVYITGTFTGTVNFGTGNLTSAGNNDIFVVKLTTTGTTSWAKRIGGTLIDNATSLKLDGSANVIITGTFAGTVDFDPGAGTANLVSVGSQDIFILKLDASGNYVWAKNIGSMTSDGGWAVAVDGTNNVFVTGSFSGIADFDPSTTNNISLTPVGGKDIFVLKLDASANYVWAKSFGGSNDEEGYSIAVDGSGNVVTTGFFYGTVDFDPGAGTSNLTSNGYDIFVSKLNSTGAFVWAKNMGGSSADYGYSIAVDALDNVYTTGYFNLTADFDPGSGTSNLISKGNSDIFLSKLNSSGNFVFVSQFGGTSGDRGLSLTANSTNNIFMTGFFSNTVDFDPSSSIVNLISEGVYDVFVLKLDIGKPAVTTNTVTSITYSSALCGGNVTSDGGYSVTARGVCWNTSPNPTILDNITTDGTGIGTFSSSLTGLTTLTTYYVRAYATNSQGTSYGNEVSFTTLTNLPAITTTAITSITATSASSGGNITSDGGFSVTARGVCWSINPNPTISDSITTDGTGTGTFISSLTGLTSLTTYYVRAYATNSQGTAYGSQVPPFTTLTTLPTVTTTAITSPTATSASGGGNVTADGGYSVTAKGVCWSTSSIPTISDSITTDGTGTGVFTSSLTGLTSVTNYYVRAYATNSQGTSYGNQVVFTTLSTLPTVTTTNVTNITDTSASSGGNVTWDGGYSISARGVCWSTSPNPTISDSITTDGTGTGVFTSSLTGLTSVTSYYVRAYATNSQGTSYGNQQTFTSSVGIDENLFYKYLKVYPNPSNGKFKIESYNNFINSIEIFNIVGQKVFSKNYLKKSKSEIDISNQNNGIYFLSVTTNDKTFTTKIILQK